MMRHAWIVTALLFAASSAWGQAIGPAPERSSWIADVIAMVLIVCVAVVSFMSSKRSHLD